jgi:prepilin-type N-terminal cleavage/methylation domain-containing protein
MKKSFTLIEVMISIVLFSIIILFLYQTLDITKKTNQFYSKKLEIKQDENRLKRLFFDDFINKQNNNIKILKDQRDNNILSLSTSNTYHNPFFTNITYLLSKDGKLIRIESLKPFDINKLDYGFFDMAFIDIIYKDIKMIKVKKIDNDILFYLKLNNSTLLIRQ